MQRNGEAPMKKTFLKAFVAISMICLINLGAVWADSTKPQPDVTVISKLKLQDGAGKLIEVKQIDVWLKGEHPELVKFNQVDPAVMLMLSAQYKHVYVSDSSGKPAMTTIVNGKPEVTPLDDKYSGIGYAIIIDAKTDKHAMLNVPNDAHKH